MDLKRKLLTSVFGLGLTGLVACPESNNVAPEKQEQNTTSFKYFAEIKNGYKYAGSIALSSGDFDGDGDLDIIVGLNEVNDNTKNEVSRLYLFKNDGQGNFSQ